MSDAFDTTATSGTGPLAPAPAPGSQLGKYKLLRLIGSGGMGNVWAAHDPDLDREVAIKLLRGAHGDGDMRTRLLREARAMARLKHPNVLTVYEVGTDGDRDYIAMELVDGHNLDAWLATKPSQTDVWDALLGAGRGLAAAHAAGLVHRDFKPHNVLRSKDGRVLVTDFGLARGLGEDAGPRPADALDTTAVPARMDSVLDSPLTRTGQLIGTPAYMAPEQFAGAPPDPRTDQFAFCVTAWQAFAGERPYRGATIEELRQAAAGERPTAKLPPGVREVLVRGLEPDPGRRWPDMPALLRALDDTRHPRRRWWPLLVPLAALAAVVIGFAALRRSATTSAPSCEAGQPVIERAWSPARRAAVLAKQPSATPFIAPLDGYRDRWLASHDAACKADRPARVLKLACLHNLRDELDTFAEIVTRFETAELARGHLDMADVVDPVETCDGNAPVTSPQFPDDQRRAPAIGLLARTYGEMLASPEKVHADHDALLAEAAAIGWAPLAPKVEELVARASLAREHFADADAAYKRAAHLAHETHDLRLEARVRLGLLELSREHIIGITPAHDYEDRLQDADLAVRIAASTPALVSRLDVARAAHAAYVDEDLSTAIELGERAVGEARGAHARREWVQAAIDLADYLSIRAKHGDLDRAATVLAEVDHAFPDPMPSPALRPLTNALYWIAWLRGDLDSVHRALDWPNGLIPIVLRGTPIHGRVVDEAGHAVANAEVMLWRHDMFGDARRMYTDPTFTQMHKTTTDAAGAFTIEAPPETGIMAELGQLRSLPVLPRSDITLVLAPTTTIHGRVDTGDDPAIGVEPFVRIRLSSDVTWSVSTAPSPDSTFTIAGIPRGAKAILGAVGSHWPRQVDRWIDAGPAIDGAVIRWPMGEGIDVVTKLSRATVWVLRGTVHPKTTAELEALAARAADVAKVRVGDVGWANATKVGMSTYAPGEMHAVIRDNAPGPATVCITGSDVFDCGDTFFDEEDRPAIRDRRRWFGAGALDMPVPVK